MAAQVDSLFLQKKFLGLLRRKKHDFSIENIFLFERESDILSVKDGLLFEFEFKTGPSDFRKDIKKQRHRTEKPNYFYYVVSDESVITGAYIKYAGIYVHRFSIDGQSLFRLIKPAIKIRDEEVTKSELYCLLKKINSNKNG